MDGWLQNVNLEWMDMLSQGNKIFFKFLCVLLVGCTTIQRDDNLFYKRTVEIIGEKEYNDISSKLKDSVDLWVLNKLGGYQAESIYDYFLDSLLCFDSAKGRFISCRHLYVNIPDATSDDLQLVYGEKINGGWYFFKGPSVTVSREMVKEHDISKPLSYQQLHEIALKEIYGGYLNSKGEINEEWFTAQFEGPGWGTFEDQASSDWFLKGKRFKIRKEYFEFVHLEKAKSVWASRDTTKPILQLP